MVSIPPTVVDDHSKCAEALDTVYLFLDNEIPETDHRKIQEHLDECGPCLAAYDLERLVKQLVLRSCSDQAAPAELRRRVLTRIREVKITIREDSFGTD
jgi:anti-sigma factor, TIGR02949 family/mycothiol system anti-sigma-R factor